ncbi:MAG: M20 family metallopeptidase [Magnetococcales bacterium]|nr:M20 family metallopeptidase [Magnetococcales bacterium]
MPDLVALTRRLIAFDTINPPGNERPCAEYLAGLLTPVGFRVMLHDVGARRATLVARLPRHPDKPALCLTGHLDTVPLGKTPWRRDPFAGEIEGDCLYGRGSSDMKSGLAALIWAALAFARDPADTGDLLLVLTADEEVGCAGSRRLVADPTILASRELEHVGAVLVCEPTANVPLLGHKGALWLELETRGIAAHGSMPERGVNAVVKAAEVVVALGRYRFPCPPHPLLGPPTLSIGTFAGGQRINIVPDHALVGVDLRTVPGLVHTELLASVQAYLGPEVFPRVVTDTPGIMTDPDHPWVAVVCAALAKAQGVPPQTGVAPYVTDASILTPALGSPPTIILGPGEPDQAHKVDEYCHVSKMETAARVYFDIVRQGC